MMIETNEVRRIIRSVRDDAHAKVTSEWIKSAVDVIVTAITERLNDYEESEICKMSEAVEHKTK